jgi:quinoprotein glucose dehydrogenase
MSKLLAMLALTLICSSGCKRSVELMETDVLLKAVSIFKFRLRRPIGLKNAGDESDRLFIVSQQGVIQFVRTDKPVDRPTIFLDIESKVVSTDQQNEEGLLGLAFHPEFRRNGEFFLCYTTAEASHTSVVSRFRVSANDPNRADTDSKEELLRIEHPFWNHNSGNLAFGPDGYLYIAVGDGGLANDPHANGQNLKTLLGSILRIDVDRQDAGKNYAVPGDNPFVQREQARDEIWAYGLRNMWGMSFDRETGTLWAADVGQDTWEEINLVERGGNYGWKLREGKHEFAGSGVEAREDLIEPI